MIARYVAFWDEREAPESLALVRILVPLALLWDFGSALVAGLLPDLWAPPPAGMGWAQLSNPAPHSVRWFGASAGTAWFSIVAAVLSASLVCAGLWLRPAAFLLAWSSAELSHLAPDGDRAIDQLLRIVVLVLAFSRADARFSVAAWWRRRAGRAPIELIPAWPRRLLFAQLVWVYFSAAHNRGGIAWWPQGQFAAIAKVLSDPHYARFTPGWTADIYPLTQLATALTMAFELGSPLLFVLAWLDGTPGSGSAVGAFVRRHHVKLYYLALGAALHLGIALTLRLGVFSFGILAIYPVFLRPGELTALVESLRRRLRPRRAGDRDLLSPK
ncbi:MAG TPA: hypothetical protein VGK73_01955 [Polyangiaceae bacterium]